MSYITQDDLITHFGHDEILELTDRFNEGEINTDILTDGITRAEAEVNSYISARYSVPLESPDAHLKQIAMDIWRYRMSDNHTTEEIKERYRDAIKWLDKVSVGRIKLDGVAQLETNASFPLSVPIERA